MAVVGKKTLVNGDRTRAVHILKRDLPGGPFEQDVKKRIGPIDGRWRGDSMQVWFLSHCANPAMRKSVCTTWVVPPSREV